MILYLRGGVMQKDNFKKIQYDIEWRKKNKKQFKVDLNISEYEELCDLLNKKGLTKVDFVRKSFEELKKK